jgi:hypothetical protein
MRYWFAVLVTIWGSRITWNDAASSDLRVLVIEIDGARGANCVGRTRPTSTP